MIHKGVQGMVVQKPKKWKSQEEDESAQNLPKYFCKNQQLRDWETHKTLHIWKNWHFWYFLSSFWAFATLGRRYLSSYRPKYLLYIYIWKNRDSLFNPKERVSDLDLQNPTKFKKNVTFS